MPGVRAEADADSAGADPFSSRVRGPTERSTSTRFGQDTPTTKGVSGGAAISDTVSVAALKAKITEFCEERD